MAEEASPTEVTASTDNTAQETGKSEGQAAAILNPETGSESKSEQSTNIQNASALKELQGVNVEKSLLDPDQSAQEHAEGEESNSEKKSDAPEQYQEFKLPEGMVLNKELADKVLPILGKYKLSQEAAQELVNAYSEQVKKEAAATQEQQQKTVKAWIDEINARPDKMSELPMAKRGVARIVSEFPELKSLFSDPVFGNMPQLYKLALFVGKNFETEGGVPIGSASNNQKNVLDKWYPSMKQ